MGSSIEMLSDPLGASFTPVRRLEAKLGAEASIVYMPAASPVAENLPSVVVTTERAAPVDSFFTETAAPGIGFPATSRTVPAMVAVSPDCACRPAGPTKTRNAHRASASEELHRLNRLRSHDLHSGFD